MLFVDFFFQRLRFLNAGDPPFLKLCARARSMIHFRAHFLRLLCKTPFFSLYPVNLRLSDRDRLRRAFHQFPSMRNLAFSHLIRAVGLMDLLFQRADLSQKLFRGHFPALALLKKLVALRFQHAQAVLGHLKLMLGQAHCFLRFRDPFFQRSVVEYPKADVRTTLCLIDFKILFRFAAVSFQRPDAAFQFACNIIQANKIFIGR